MTKNVEAKTFNSNDKEFEKIIKKAEQNQEFRTAIFTREAEGFTVDQETVVQEITTIIENENKVAYVATRSVRSNGNTVGEVTFLDTDEEETAFSKVERDDNKTDLLYFENGELKQQIVNQEDSIQTLGISKTKCKVLVKSICSAGLSTSVSGCAAGCTTFGPGMIVCWPLCAGLVAVGCNYGGEAACAWVD